MLRTCAFALLEQAGRLEASLSDRMKRMVGFRNVSVHDYRRLNLDIVRSIVRKRLDDFIEFARVVLRG